MHPTMTLIETCPPVCTGTGVAVVGVELPRTGRLEELEELAAPGTCPGRTSGVSIKVRHVCEAITGERDNGENSHHQRHTIC